MLGPVLLSARYLVDRMRHRRSRADELAALRARFAVLPSRRAASPAQRASAEALRRLREELATALASVSACGGCARGRPEPQGRWAGGFCCGGETLSIWSREECAALKLAGTDPAALEAPRGDHAGCVFRGERGCSLPARDRPSLCVRFLCQELREELRKRDDWAHIASLASAIDREQQRFEELL